MRFGENVLNVIDRVKQKIEKDIAPSLPEGVKIVTTYDRIRPHPPEHRHAHRRDHQAGHCRERGVPGLPLPSAQRPGGDPDPAGGHHHVLHLHVLLRAHLERHEPKRHRHCHRRHGGCLHHHGGKCPQASGGVGGVGQAGFPGARSSSMPPRRLDRPSSSRCSSSRSGFLPVFTLEAQAGRLFKPLAFTKTFAMLFSSLLAVTLTPMLMTFFIRGKIRPEDRNPISRALRWVYEPAAEAGPEIPQSRHRCSAHHHGSDRISLYEARQGVHAASERGNALLHAGHRTWPFPSARQRGS